MDRARLEPWKIFVSMREPELELSMIDTPPRLDASASARPEDATAAATVASASAKLLIYGMNYAPEPTGVGRYSGELGAYMARMGHPVEAITTPPHYPGWAPRDGFRNWFSVETRDGERIIRCPLLLRRQMRGIWRAIAPISFALTSGPVVAWRILKSKPATVLCVEPTLFSAPIALIAAKLVRARTVLHVQDLEIDAAFAVGHFENRLVRSLAMGFERMVLKHFDQVVTISTQMKRGLAAKGIDPANLEIVRNWVDTSKIKPMPGPNGFRRELGLDDDKFVVLYAGNIGAKQGMHTLFDAAEQLVDQKDIVFVVAGDGPERESLAKRALPNVRMLPTQPEARLCELLNMPDMHVLPQDSGAADLVLPSKLGGMLASGKPCLVTADAGTELYQFLDGVAALVPAGNPSALAEALRQMAKTEVKTSGEAPELVSQLEATTNLAAFRKLLMRPATA